MDVAANQIVPDILHLWAKRTPDKDFVVFESDSGAVETLTYAGFAERVDRLSAALIAQGVEPTDKVAVMLGNCPDFLISWFAVMQAGAVMVPVNVLYAPDELQYLVNNSDSVALITEPKYLHILEPVAGQCAGLKWTYIARTDETPRGFLSVRDAYRTAPTGPTAVRVDPAEASEIVFTSGTTSRPKGAIISHRSAVIQGIATAMLFGLRPDDRTCVLLPLFHVNGQYVGFLPTLTVGAAVVLIETFSARNYWAQVRKHNCTGISIVPMILRTLLAQPPSPDDTRHSVRFSFYALPTSSEEWTQFEDRFGVRLIEGYGLSETLGICSSNPVVHGFAKRHCIGLPLLGREMRVVDENYQDVPVGTVGQVLVRGEAMFSGYYKNPEATDACMIDGWFATGDNAIEDADGYFSFFDRSKDVIKRAGENISATEVERVLNDHPKIAESAVIAVFDPIRDEAVKAFVVLQPNETLSEAEVQAWCAERLAKFKVPSFCEFRPSLPRTSIGKIMKYQLKAEENARRAQS